MLGGALAVAVGAAIIAKPSPEKLLHRMILDEQRDRAQSVLDKIPEARQTRRETFYDIVRLWLIRGTMDMNKPEEAARLFERVRTLWNKKPDEILERELAILLPMIGDESLAEKQLGEIIPSLDKRREKIFIRTLQDAALSAKNPGVAALGREIAAQGTSMTIPEAVETAELWNWAGRPDKALALLDLQVKDAARPQPKNDDYNRVRVQLLRASNDNFQAFDFLVAWRRMRTGTPEEKEIVGHLVDAGLAAQRQEEVSREFQSWADEHPDDLQTLSKLADICAAALHMDEAVAALRKAVTLEPGNLPLRKKLANFLEWDNHPAEAFREYAHIAAEGDLSVLPRMLSLNTGLYEDAVLLQSLESAFLKHPKDIILLKTLAQAMVKAGRYTDAEARLRDYLSAVPTDIAAWVEHAQLCRVMELFPEAEKSLLRALKLRPNTSTELSLAEVEYYLGEYRKSFQHFKSLAAKVPSPALITAYVGAAEALGDLEDWVAAREMLMVSGVKLIPQDYQRLAYGHAQLGDRTKHIRVLESGIRAFPEHSDMRIQLVWALVASGKHSQALTVLDGEPHNRTGQTWLGLRLRLLLLTNRHQEALTMIRDPILRPLLEEPSLAMEAARVCLKTGHLDEAAARIRSILPSLREDPEPHLLLADILLRQGQTQAVLALLSQAPPLTTPEHLAEAARLYTSAGRPRNAESCLRRAVAQAPHDYRAWGAYGDLLLNRGQKPAAREAYRLAIDKIRNPQQSVGN